MQPDASSMAGRQRLHSWLCTTRCREHCRSTATAIVDRPLSPDSCTSPTEQPYPDAGAAIILRTDLQLRLSSTRSFLGPDQAHFATAIRSLLAPYSFMSVAVSAFQASLKRSCTPAAWPVRQVLSALRTDCTTRGGSLQVPVPGSRVSSLRLQTGLTSIRSLLAPCSFTV